MAKKHTKKALFTSVMSLVLCFAMLVGTTFAWFTDSVTSGVNQINAGNLDVELYHSDKDDAGYVTNSDELFNDITLWEPGVAVYENFKVENKGTLALKYQMTLNCTNATATPEGKTLADVLKVAVVPGGFEGDRKDAQTLTYNNTLSSFTLNGELKGNETSQTYGVVIYWEPTENDNAYNMNNANQGKVLSIDLGINLFATQVEHEADSFGVDYDAEASLCKFIVTNEEELKAALAEVQNGDHIGIDGNVTWTTGAGIGSTPFSETPVSFTLTAVSPNATLTAIGSGVGAVGVDGATVTFKNLKIVDNSVSYAENSWEYGYLEFRGNTVFQNCQIVNAIMMDGDSATFNNCSFVSSVDSEYAVWVSNGDASFEGCYFTGTRGIKIHEAYGSEVGTVVINDNDFGPLTKKPGLAIGDVNADTTIKLTNNLFAATQAGDQENYKYETDTAIDSFNFVEENNTVKESAKIIATAADLLALSAQSLNGEIELIADIDMNGADFSAIIVPRSGSLIFNGNGYTISNVNVISGAGDNTTGQASMFYGFPGTTLNVSNLKLKDLTVTTDANDAGYGAAVVGYNEGTTVLNDVDVINATINGAKSSGMLAGHVSGSLTATGCDVSGSVTLSDYEDNGHYAAKYVGTAAGSVTLDSCTANVTIGGNLNAKNVGDVYGRMTDAATVTVDGVALNNAATQEALDTAVNTNGNTSITLSAGDYKMPSTSSTGTITITGTKDTVIDNTMGAYMESAKVSFDGVTIKGSTGMVNGNGADYAALYTPDVTYTNCTFVGPMRVGRDGAKFINCTFTELGNDYIWTYGNDVIFEGCTFNTAGKAILIYSDGGNEVAEVSVKNCTFNATTGAKAGAIANQNCAAIEIHNYGNGVNLTTEGNTIGDNFSGEWRIKTYEAGRTQVSVNGTEYTTIAIDGKIMTIDADKNVTVNP